MGAMSFMGKIPTASELIATAGRIFFISAPFDGSKFTNHISPRLGSGESVLD